MEEYKTCKKCGESKNISEYYHSKKNKDGSQGYRPECKTCFNSRKKNERDSIKINNLPVKNNITTIKQPAISNKGIAKDNFLEIFDKADLLKVMTNKENRTKNTFNLDTDAKDILKKYQEQSKLNISDILNLVIYKFHKDNLS